MQKLAMNFDLSVFQDLPVHFFAVVWGVLRTFITLIRHTKRMELID